MLDFSPVFMLSSATLNPLADDLVNIDGLPLWTSF
jgi:hypothetical protein